MALIDPSADLLVAGTLFAVVSFVVQRTLGQRDRVKTMQKRMNEIQKEIAAATKSGDEAHIKRMEPKEKEMMSIMQETMGLSFKPLIVIIPLFIGFMALLQGPYNNFLITLPFGIHVPEILRWPPAILSPSVYGYRGFFIVCSFFANLWLEFLYGRIQKAKEGKKPKENKAVEKTDSTPAPATPA